MMTQSFNRVKWWRMKSHSDRTVGERGRNLLNDSQCDHKREKKKQEANSCVCVTIYVSEWVCSHSHSSPDVHVHLHKCATVALAFAGYRQLNTSAHNTERQQSTGERSTVKVESNVTGTFGFDETASASIWYMNICCSQDNVTRRAKCRRRCLTVNKKCEREKAQPRGLKVLWCMRRWERVNDNAQVTSDYDRRVKHIVSNRKEDTRLRRHKKSVQCSHVKWKAWERCAPCSSVCSFCGSSIFNSRTVSLCMWMCEHTRSIATYLLLIIQ